MTSLALSKKVTSSKLFLILVAALLVRLVSLALYPLMDTTEARYGEMARLMVETTNWLTPQFDYGVPFWGKPPLQNWMSASFIQLFHNSEFFLRLPHFLAGIAILLLMMYFAKRFAINGIKAAIILTTTVVFYVCIGTVMTDMGLLLGLSIALLSFYLAWQGQYFWGYVGFVGLAIGLMSKGPVSVVIFGIATALFMLWSVGPIKMWSLLWQRVPLVSGSLLMLSLTLPWYVMAEQATPGFIQYFIVGEHWLRFIDSGWQGDLYGSAHDEIRGTIWLYFAVACLPWTLFLPRALYRIYQGEQQFDPLTQFLICWMIAPLLLFTFAGNILPAYVLPASPALALLIAHAWKDSPILKFNLMAVGTPALLIMAVIVLNSGVSQDKSDKWLLAQRVDSLDTFYWLQQPFSSRYYSDGKASVISDEQQLQSLKKQAFYMVVTKKQLEHFNSFSQCKVEVQTRKKVLLLCNDLTLSKAQLTSESKLNTQLMNKHNEG
ncbi:ArnT family glycosyltransferase [Shewanella donghaensis]|uniref:ArnT family glycosyltransferase n=1 Tax=Shewanella donghaensis TaxID=238836 RepID=UPI0011823542|nr:glycosyltransferase family 39 protein [Shewanella donghaensis]